MLKKRIKKMTALEWSSYFDINFISLDGFTSKKSFNYDLIDKHTFLLCAANCVISEPFQKSRREVSNFKQKLINAK